MPNVISLTGQPTRCGECRQAADCLLAVESGAGGRNDINSRIRLAHDGDRIHRAGEPVEAVYRVRSGSVKTCLTGRDGEEQVTGFYGPGEWLGLDALGGGRHRSDAVALDTTSVCVIPLAQLRDHLNRSAGGSQCLTAAVSERLARKEELHLHLARDGAAQRLAGFILDLCERRDVAGLDANLITLPMSRADIASYLALAVETVSRILTRMHRAGTIEVQRHHLVVLDRAALCTEAGLDPVEIQEHRAAVSHH